MFKSKEENLRDVLYLREEPDKGHEITMAMLQDAIQFLKINLSN